MRLEEELRVIDRGVGAITLNNSNLTINNSNGQANSILNINGGITGIAAPGDPLTFGGTFNVKFH